MYGQGCGYDDLDELMTARSNVYPIELKLRYRNEYDEALGAGPVLNHPWASQLLEVQPKPHLAPGIAKSQYVDAHQIRTTGADPGRFLGHPSRIVAPLIIDSNQPQTFDRPHPITAWAPNPIVQRSYGQHTLAPDDMRHTVPKQLLGYSTDALSQQEIVDEAMLRVRRSMYGR